MAYQEEYTKWRAKLEMVLLKKYNRNIESLKLQVEFYYLYGYSVKETLDEIEHIFIDLKVVKKSAVDNRLL